MADSSARAGSSALPSIVQAAGRGMAAVEDAARREPRAVARSLTTVGVTFVVLLFAWATWFAPWARSLSNGAAVPAAPVDPKLAPATRGDIEQVVAPLRTAIDSIGTRVDRLYERSR